jgi:hypothetical protein
VEQIKISQWTWIEDLISNFNRKERQWRFLHCQYIKMRKECIINKHSSIFIGVVLFCILLYIEYFYSYMKINVNDKTKMNHKNYVIDDREGIK